MVDRSSESLDYLLVALSSTFTLRRRSALVSSGSAVAAALRGAEDQIANWCTWRSFFDGIVAQGAAGDLHGYEVATSASMRAVSSGRENIGQCPVGSRTTRKPSPNPANMGCRSATIFST